MNKYTIRKALQEIDTRIKNTYNKAEVNALNIEREQLMELLGD